MILLKRFLLSALLLFGAFILTTNNIIAERYPCVPDCQESATFSYPHTTDYFEINGCTEQGGPSCQISVLYTWRTGCDDWQDLQILDVNMWYTSNCKDECDHEVIFKLAVLAVIKKNRMGFDPQVDSVGCDSTWRVITHSCYNNFYLELCADPPPDPPLPVDSTLVMIPCEGDSCCNHTMAVCRDEDGGVTVTSLDDNSLQEYCEDPCTEVCDWLDFYQLYFIKAPCLENYDDQQPSIISQVGDPIKIIIHKETIELKEFHGKKGTMTFNLFDIYGNAVIQTSAQIGSVNDRMIINTSDLISGVYLYQIVFDDTVLQTGKLPIVR